MYPAAESDPKVAYKEPLFFGEHQVFTNVREAPIEENTAMECNSIMDATYVCKILQLYEHKEDEYWYQANCEWCQFMQHKR